MRREGSLRDESKAGEATRGYEISIASLQWSCDQQDWRQKQYKYPVSFRWGGCENVPESSTGRAQTYLEAESQYRRVGTTFER